MSVAAWSPLGGGALSGKFTNPASYGPTRLSAESSKDDHAVAHVVQGVADELGASASQVALAWTMTHSRAVYPIAGVRTLEQLTDNLGALDVALTPELTTRLEAATQFKLGFPHDFIRDMQSFVYGEAGSLGRLSVIDPRHHALPVTSDPASALDESARQGREDVVAER